MAMVNVAGELINEEDFKASNGLKSIPGGKTKYTNRRFFTDELVMLITEGDGTKHVIKTLVGNGQEITDLSSFNFEILIRDDQEQDLE